MKLNGLILLAWLGLALAGCTPFTEAAQPNQSDFVLLNRGQTVGQTFVAHYDGLSGIGLIIEPVTAGNGTLQLELRESPNDPRNLRTAEIPLSSINASGTTVFYFAPVVDSNQGDYYFSLRLEGSGSVKVGVSNTDAYLDGAFYQDEQPQDAQTTFQLIYGRRFLSTGLIQEGLRWCLWTIVGLFLFVIPGWAVLDLLQPNWQALNFWEKFSLSSGISLVLYPLLILWTSLIGLQLGVVYAWLPGASGLFYLLIRYHQQLVKLKFRLQRPAQLNWPALALGIVVVMIVAVRYWVIRDLDLPLLGDGYQHTLIAQLIADNGGLFKTWLPYADLYSFTYHFGFHSLAAVYHWITNTSLPQAILWIGQMLNVLAVIAVYPLTNRITRNPWAGVVAVLSAGLLFSMPMFYTNWGRYTQLAGLVILSAWTLLTWEALDDKKTNWRLIILCWIALGGLALTHYRVLIFAVLFFVAYYLLNLRSGRLIQQVIRGVIICTGALLLALPWYLNTISGTLITGFSNQLTTPASQLSSATLERYAIGNILAYLPAWVWISLPLIIVWGLWKRQKGIALISLWWFLILVAANPQWLNLPGAGIITSFAVMISAFFPASILIGAAAGRLIDSLQRLDWRIVRNERRAAQIKNTIIPVIMLFLILAGGLYGARARLHDIVIAQYALALPPDRRAAEWIKENLPTDARLLVNSFFAYDGEAIVGSDGGWWLPLLSGRQTSLPPLPYMNEQGPRPDYREWINTLVADIQEKGISHPDVLKELEQRGIDYVYIGQQQGAVNSPEPMIKLSLLLESQEFQPVYHQDRVWVFKRVNSSN